MNDGNHYVRDLSSHIPEYPTHAEEMRRMQQSYQVRLLAANKFDKNAKNRL